MFVLTKWFQIFCPQVQIFIFNLFESIDETFVCNEILHKSCLYSMIIDIFVKNTENINLYIGFHNVKNLFFQFYDIERCVKTLFTWNFEFRNILWFIMYAVLIQDNFKMGIFMMYSVLCDKSVDLLKIIGKLYLL